MIDPATRIRHGIDTRRGESVKTKAGAVLVILPVLMRAIDVLAGRCPDWHLDLLELRNQWAMAVRRKRQPDLPAETVWRVAREAVIKSYDISGGALDEWFTDDDGETLLMICTAAMGAIDAEVAQSNIRRRALAVALAGCGELPLSAIEMTETCDFVIATGRAPEGV
jgi:hypothetical protein